MKKITLILVVFGIFVSAITHAVDFQPRLASRLTLTNPVHVAVGVYFMGLTKSKFTALHHHSIAGVMGSVESASIADFAQKLDESLRLTFTSPYDREFRLKFIENAIIRLSSESLLLLIDALDLLYCSWTYGDEAYFEDGTPLYPLSDHISYFYQKRGDLNNSRTLENRRFTSAVDISDLLLTRGYTYDYSRKAFRWEEYGDEYHGRKPRRNFLQLRDERDQAVNLELKRVCSDYGIRDAFRNCENSTVYQRLLEKIAYRLELITHSNGTSEYRLVKN